MPPPSSAPDSPPRHLLPGSFTLSLYSPDSSVTVTLKSSALRGNVWEFLLPQRSFPRPSNSHIDASYTPPQTDYLLFRWRKEGGVLSRAQLKCSLVGGGGGEEPDSQLAMYTGVGDRAGRGEMSIYESNFRRVEIQDPKGLDMVLLLSARVINDVWFLPSRGTFNAPAVSGRPRARGGSEVAPLQPQPQQPQQQPPSPPPPPAETRYPADKKPPVEKAVDRVAEEQAEIRQMLAAEELQNKARRQQGMGGTFAARFAAQGEGKEVVEPHEIENRRRIAAEQADIRHMLAAEENQSQARKQAQVEAETERLRSLYGGGDQLNRRASVPQQQVPRVVIAPPLPANTNPRVKPQRMAGRPRPEWAVPGQPRPQSFSGQLRSVSESGLQTVQPPAMQAGGGSGDWLSPAAAAAPGKRLDATKSRRKSFMGFCYGKPLDSAAVAAAEEEKKKKKLSKKKSSMW